MGYIDIRKLNIDELVGVVSLYPWFGGARKELCRRMSGMGEGWDVAQYADAAMYISARERISDIMRSGIKGNWSDSDVEKLIKSYLSEKQEVEDKAEGRKVYAGVGDYFSQEDYDNVRTSDDNVFSRYAAKARREKPEQLSSDVVEDIGFYTETLAQIYAEQGYYSQAKKIYSKLILAYPEKSAYFASLIQKIDEIN
jgi:hypothetical protein